VVSVARWCASARPPIVSGASTIAAWSHVLYPGGAYGLALLSGGSPRHHRVGDRPGVISPRSRCAPARAAWLVAAASIVTRIFLALLFDRAIRLRLRKRVQRLAVCTRRRSRFAEATPAVV
jgi:hypothetical protein